MEDAEEEEEGGDEDAEGLREEVAEKKVGDGEGAALDGSGRGRFLKGTDIDDQAPPRGTNS